MKLFIFLLCVVAVIGTTTILERIPDYVRQLCPKSNVCDVNMGDNIGDPDSCCTDCSCKSDCAANGNCCFVSRTQATEPSTIDVISPIDTIEDDRVQCLYPVTGDSETFDFLNFFSYNMLSSPNGKNGNCANKKVAPWGSLYPVYSKQTNKIYHNDMCAQEYNVTDGVLWKAFLTCKSKLSRNTDIAKIFSFLEKGKVSIMLCRVYFTYPGESTDIRSHVCYKDMIDQCSGVEFQVPSNLNATKQDISEACQSGLISPYYSTFDLYANVFCLLCSGLRFNANDRCENNHRVGDRDVAGKANFLALLDPVAIATMTNLIDNGPKACRINTHQNASDCRQVLCPFAQIRNAYGRCVFQAKVWYQHFYSIAVELRSEQNIDLKEAFHWQDDQKVVSDIQPLTVLNSMELASWTVDDLLYGSKKLDTSRTTNTLLVVLSRNFITSDPADIIRNMSFLMHMNWLLSYGNESLVLKPSQFKLKAFVHDQGLLTSGRFKVNDSYHEMYLSYKRLYTSISNIQSSFLTKLYFCDQVELRIGEYIISTDHRVLYNTFSKMYLFDGEFDLNYDGSVKICLENSGFVKSIVACANVHTQPALCRLYILQVLLCFVFMQRYCIF